MSEKTERAGRYRLFAARLRAIAAADVAQENCDLLHQVVDDFEQMAGDLEAIDQLGALKEESPEPVAASMAGLPCSAGVDPEQGPSEPVERALA